MRITRHRIAALAGGSALALAASVLSPVVAQADPVPSTASGVTVVKAMSPASPADGGTVTTTLTLSNSGPTANNVEIEDYYDYGLDPVTPLPGGCVDEPFDAGTPPLTYGGRITCTLASVANGPNVHVINIDYIADYVGPTMYSFWRKSDERMEIQKTEGHISLLEDATGTVFAQCETGYHIMDFGLVKQHVDQDEGDYEHIRVVSTNLVDARTWSATLQNKSTGQIQAKVYATCIRDTTNVGTTLTFLTPIRTMTVNLHPQAPDEPRPLYAYCPPTHTPIAVNVRSVADPLHPLGPNDNFQDEMIILHGFEADGGQRTRLWVEALEPANVTVEWQCMKTETSSGRPMQFDFLVTGDRTVNPGEKKRKKLECNVGYKGVIGGWMGGKINGHEPQPIARVFWFYNETPATITYDLTLLCLRNRLLKTNRLEVDDTVDERLVNYVSGVEERTTTPEWIAPDEDFVDVDY